MWKGSYSAGGQEMQTGRWETRGGEAAEAGSSTLSVRTMGVPGVWLGCRRPTAMGIALFFWMGPRFIGDAPDLPMRLVQPLIHLPTRWGRLTCGVHQASIRASLTACRGGLCSGASHRLLPEPASPAAI